jgi:hypothetical protein
MKCHLVSQLRSRVIAVAGPDFHDFQRHILASQRILRPVDRTKGTVSEMLQYLETVDQGLIQIELHRPVVAQYWPREVEAVVAAESRAAVRAAFVVWRNEPSAARAETAASHVWFLLS